MPIVGSLLRGNTKGFGDKIMRELSFREAQLAALDVLNCVVKICKNININYYLAYGTLIGAVRHKGFIPWDDDLDIIMMRPDYDKFIDYFKNNTANLGQLKLFERSIDDNYPHMIARVSDSRYYLQFENEIDYGLGAFIDVYPFDGVGNNYSEAVKLIKKAKRSASLCFLTSRKKFGVDNTNSKIKMLIKFPAYLWAKFIGRDHYMNKLDKLSQSYAFAESKYVACVEWPDGITKDKDKDIFDKSIFEPIEMEFEGRMYTAPKGYDEFLTRIYGNYMMPPDEAGKKTHHTFKAYRKDIN